MAQHSGAQQSGRIYLGIGGWTFEPWRGVFYPEGLPQAQELEYAAQHLTSIEINGTFYRTQTPGDASASGRAKCLTTSCSRSRRRATRPTAASSPRPATRSSASSSPA